MRARQISCEVLWASFVAVLSATSGIAQRQSGVLHTTVCSIVLHPEEFDGRLVRVRARINSDGIERTVLFSDKCPDRGIALVVPPECSQTTGVLSLHRAIFGGHPGTADKRIEGTFSGTFLWSPMGVPSRTMQVQQITHIQVSSLEEKP
jgi:hypothetical protein